MAKATKAKKNIEVSLETVLWNSIMMVFSWRF